MAINNVNDLSDIKEVILTEQGLRQLIKKIQDADDSIKNNYIPKSTLSGAFDIMYSSAANTPARLEANKTTTKKFLSMTGTNSSTGADPVWDTVTQSDVGLGNVENIKLSTWEGSANITKLGTIATGTIPWARLSGIPTASSNTSGLVKIGDNINNTNGTISVPVANTDTTGVITNSIQQFGGEKLFRHWSGIYGIEEPSGTAQGDRKRSLLGFYATNSTAENKRLLGGAGMQMIKKDEKIYPGNFVIYENTYNSSTGNIDSAHGYCFQLPDVEPDLGAMIGYNILVSRTFKEISKNNSEIALSFSSGATTAYADVAGVTLTNTVIVSPSIKNIYLSQKYTKQATTPTTGTYYTLAAQEQNTLSSFAQNTVYYTVDNTTSPTYYERVIDTRGTPKSGVTYYTLNSIQPVSSGFNSETVYYAKSEEIASSWEVWRDAGIRCSGQHNGQLTFKADDNVAVTTYFNVIILD